MTRSPIFALFGETLNGLSTIRAFDAQGAFREAFAVVVGRNMRAQFSDIACNVWLGVWLMNAGAVLVLATTLMAVVTRCEAPRCVGCACAPRVMCRRP